MSTTERRQGFFVTFEGIDGCGKSTQINLLVERLSAKGQPVTATVEPGGTEIGQQVRRILLDARNHRITATTELLLYFASRAQNVEERIRPALERGEVVVSDRYTDSTLVYQGVARGLGSAVVADLHRIACGGLNPDLTIVLDIDLETSLARARARNKDLGSDDANQTRMDDQTTAFYRRVREGYRHLAAREPGRVKVIDGNRTIELVAADVWTALEAARV